jgi:hypothetical protein
LLQALFLGLDFSAYFTQAIDSFIDGGHVADTSRSSCTCLHPTTLCFSV